MGLLAKTVSFCSPSWCRRYKAMSSGINPAIGGWNGESPTGSFPEAMLDSCTNLGMIHGRDEQICLTTGLCGGVVASVSF